MCRPINRRDPRTRRHLAIANLSLAAALAVLNISRSAGPVARDWFDGIYGSLLGLFIAIQFLIARRVRQCGS